VVGPIVIDCNCLIELSLLAGPPGSPLLVTAALSRPSATLRDDAALTVLLANDVGEEHVERVGLLFLSLSFASP
jgi:hypothetical protein